MSRGAHQRARRAAASTTLHQPRAAASPPPCSASRPGGVRPPASRRSQTRAVSIRRRGAIHGPRPSAWRPRRVHRAGPSALRVEARWGPSALDMGSRGHDPSLPPAGPRCRSGGPGHRSLRRRRPPSPRPRAPPVLRPDDLSSFGRAVVLDVLDQPRNLEHDAPRAVLDGAGGDDLVVAADLRDPLLEGDVAGLEGGGIETSSVSVRVPPTSTSSTPGTASTRPCRSSAKRFSVRSGTGPDRIAVGTGARWRRGSAPRASRRWGAASRVASAVMV